MTFIMMLVGLGMVLGNLLSGKLSGRYTPLRIAVVTDLVIVLSLSWRSFSSADTKQHR